MLFVCHDYYDDDKIYFSLAQSCISSISRVVFVWIQLLTQTNDFETNLLTNPLPELIVVY